LRRDKIIDPSTFIIVSKELSQTTGFNHLFSGEQNDPHEFLAYILDVIHNAKSTEVSINIPQNISEYSEVNQLYFKHFKARYQRDHSLFVQKLYYYIVNCVLCNKCGNKTNEVSPNDMICLPLPPNIKKDDRLSILDCFDQLFSIEGLEYKCEKCENSENNQIEKKILTKPKTLIIKIKRYANVGPNGNMLMKINKFIAYPDVLNISKYCCVDNPYNYELYGVINHVGFLNSGHYYSYIRERISIDNNNSKFTNRWFLCNDTRVNVMNIDDVLKSSNAYMLFYQIKT
jgi:ubiquitin C-terminal hydrolase